MERLIPIGIILSLSGIGFILKIIQIRNYIIRIESCTDYQDKFIDLVNKYTSTYQLDNALYSELTRKSIPMQRELGLDGEIDMVDNLRGLKFNGYQVLLNFLPEIREMDDWHNNSIMRQRFMTLAHTCDDMFTRHIGHLDDLLEYEKNICIIHFLASLVESVGYYGCLQIFYFGADLYRRIQETNYAIIGLLKRLLLL